MSLEPFQTVFPNRRAVRKQKKRTDMIVALKVEVWDTIDTTTKIDVERNPETLHTGHRLGSHHVSMKHHARGRGLLPFLKLLLLPHWRLQSIRGGCLVVLQYEIEHR